MCNNVTKESTSNEEDCEDINECFIRNLDILLILIMIYIGILVLIFIHSLHKGWKVKKMKKSIVFRSFEFNNKKKNMI